MNLACYYFLFATFQITPLLAAKSSGNPIATVIGLSCIVAGFVIYFIGKGRGYLEGNSQGRCQERDALDARYRELDATAKKMKDDEVRAERERQEVCATVERKLKHAETLERAAASKLKEAKIKFDEAYSEKEYLLHEYEKEIRAIAQTCVSSHPNNAYIAEVWNGTCEAVICDIIHDLEWRGSEKTAKRIEKKFNSSARQWQYEAKYYKLQTLLYESLFPELLDYTTDESDHSVSPPIPERTSESDWLSDEEWHQLSPTEKSQRALDLYIASPNKSKWQIGRDYELFIGYCYRRKRFRVEHIGTEKKLDDMGRDLICHSDPLSSPIETHIVQCKCWSQSKKIHEKHITQLFGTTVEYAIAHKIKLVNGRLPPCLKAVLVTSTELSETARLFANALGVEYHENIPLPKKADSFPRIKCNKSSGIFHLPFDEQYDATRINPEEGDCVHSIFEPF